VIYEYDVFHIDVSTGRWGIHGDLWIDELNRRAKAGWEVVAPLTMSFPVEATQAGPGSEWRSETSALLLRREL